MAPKRFPSVLHVERETEVHSYLPVKGMAAARERDLAIGGDLRRLGRNREALELAGKEYLDPWLNCGTDGKEERGRR